jgi:integrase
VNFRDEPEADGARHTGHHSPWAQNTDETPDARESQDGALVALAEASDDGARRDGAEADGRTWRQELPRWLATLNSKRTRKEYEKAVLYFFLAPGVPPALTDLTLDLLLAYRGSLALRADRETSTSAGRAAASGHARQVVPGRGEERYIGDRVDAGNGPDEDGSANEDADQAAGGTGRRPTAAQGPLAPATVNVRLTALRQFLTHCGLWGQVPQLPPERMRAALRRLAIERRRPYQILAEPEWAAFLTAARAPAVRAAATIGISAHPPASDSTAAEQEEAPRPASRASAEAETANTSQGGVWGVPRAVRLRAVGDASAADSLRAAPAVGVQGDTPGARRLAHSPYGMQTTPRIRSRAGLTGERTALRDHALLALALATGLRAIELCALDLGDLSREWHAGQKEWWLVLPDAKTKGQHGGRTLPLAPTLLRILLDYVKTTGRQWENAAHRGTPLFLSQRRPSVLHDAAHSSPGARWPRLSTEQVRRIVDRVETQWIASSVGEDLPQDVTVPGEGRAISPHALRHSTAVALLEGNERSGRAPASVEHVRGWLGHFDIRTTQGYLAHLDARRNRRPYALQPAEEAASAAGERDAEPDLSSAQQE